MRNFIGNLFRFSLIGLIPFTMLGIAYVILDPFKVIKTYDVLLDQNAKAWVSINKDYLSSTTFIKNSKTVKYNSFIFGSSRSIYYLMSDWKKHLPANATCFHFDASGESLWALTKKVEFVDKKGVEMENVLIVLDSATLVQDKAKAGHLYVTSPALLDNSNIIDFHKTFFLAFLTPKFLYAYMDFKISGTVKPYMTKNSLLDNKPRAYDSLTNEVRFDYFEKLIGEDKYYNKKRLAVFYKRDGIERYSAPVIKENQKILLTTIQSIFRRHKSNVKIVISPLYNQKKFNKEDLEYLHEMFGIENVFDFSGINKFTNDYRNYYEASHYRPHVTREIMEIVYKKDQGGMQRMSSYDHTKSAGHQTSK